MKVLVLSSQAKNTGSTLRAEYIYKYLKKEKINCDYFSPPFKSMPFMLDFLLSMFYYFFKVMNKKYDIIFIVKPYPNTVFPAILLKNKNTKIVIDIDDLDYGYRKNFLSNVIRFLQQKLIRHADFLTSHNDNLIKLIKKEYPKFKNKLIKLNQCVDIDIFNVKKINLREVKKIRKKYKDKKILFYMANLNIASYLDDILYSLKFLDGNVVLLIVGDGPLFEYYLKKAKELKVNDKVEFLGEVKKEKIVNYIYASDICLVYYKDLEVNKYRASMKLREYLSLNKPVVANNIGEIKNFKDYIYLSGKSLNSFIKEIKKRIISLDKREKKGYNLIRQNYNWKEEIKKLKKLFERF